ncbi:uncharacterized protein BDR25DRAFT_308741 [Lindgomyces ingoldianus]|uniref:Uncharacterized protein n=1 Tax=Lindgomyces ingoldianus TaxID=673940 RepID=A0ACB6RHU2_9PLEO|nr:uncharacterized protein BDR25DRAFT_308741 [Lindgomyces ingoldianus]KAF2477892.1 hypothetical protein BDR25DRAFT_308741 [Lindgomyces ingoldianus]
MSRSDEDGWEYEYDQSKTEDFYITLDLSNLPDREGAPAPYSRGAGGRRPVILHNRLREVKGRKGNSKPVTQVPDHQDTENVGQMQITGLHTLNPLVTYNGQLLSCKWASTIGTDMLFVKRGADTTFPENPLRSLHSVDLLAISSTRLMATTARLRPRDELFDPGEGDEGTTVDAMDLSVDTVPTEQRRPTPSEFLTKFNQVKARRGESRLVVSRTCQGSRLVVDREGVVSATLDGAASQSNEDIVMEDLMDQEPEQTAKPSQVSVHVTKSISEMPVGALDSSMANHLNIAEESESSGPRGSGFQ